MTSTEDRLRAALAARADLVRAEHVGEALPLPGPRSAPRRRLSSTGTRLTVVAAAAATVGVLLTPQLLRSPAPPTTGPTSGPVNSASVAPALTVVFPGPMTIEFLDGMTTSAKITRPTFQVTGGAPGVADKVRSTIDRHLEAQVSARLKEFSEEGTPPPRELTEEVVAGGVFRWSRYLTVRFEETSTGGAHPVSSTSVLVFDTSTGDEVRPGQLFTDPAAVDAIVRQAAHAAPDNLACYPAAAGLTCVDTTDTRAPRAVAQHPVTVPWAELSGLLRPEAGGTASPPADS